MGTATKRKVARVTRVQKVDRVIARAKGPVKTEEIAQKTGYSPRLVLSTIRFVNRTVNAMGSGRMYAFDTKRKGWKVAATWDERSKWHLTLHAHARTRVDSLRAESEVALALWPVAVPAGLAADYEKALRDLDRAGGKIASLAGAKGKTPKVKTHRKRVRKVA